MTLIEDPETGYRTGTIEINGDSYEIGPIANLFEANLEGADLRRVYLSGADLRGANLEGANLEEANLEGANLKGADLEGANLTEANLRETNLIESGLRDANLSGADLRRANLFGANLTGSIMTTGNWDDIIESSLYPDQIIGSPSISEEDTNTYSESLSRRETMHGRTSDMDEFRRSKPVPKGIQELYENDNCPVCLEDYTGKKKCVMTNCGHLTCMECMQGMVDSGMNLNCPTCRKSFAFGYIISRKQ